MATASSHEIVTSLSSIPVTNKLHDRLDILRCVIDSKKSLVRQVGDEMKQLIDRKVDLIMMELEAIWTDANHRAKLKTDEMHEKIQDLNKHKIGIDKILKEFGQTPCFNQIDEQMESVTREMDIDIPFVKLKWKVDNLRDSINALCTCEQRSVKFREDIPIPLKCSSCDKGEEDNQLFDPYGIAVDSDTDIIYVADAAADRIQIFSGKGECNRSLQDDQLSYPEHIIISYNSIFVQCYTRVVRFNKSTLQREAYTQTANILSGICTDSTHIYVGVYKCIQLTLLTTDLREEETISLITEFKRECTLLEDVSLARDVFYVALTQTEYPIQTFSKEGTLLRCVVHTDKLVSIECIYLDTQLNILVTDAGSNEVKIFSNGGKLVSRFGKAGTNLGEFDNLKGIAVYDTYSIITCDKREHSMIQIFSPLCS